MTVYSFFQINLSELDEFIAKNRVDDCDCGLIVCVCSEARKHTKECRYRIAMTCAIPFECEEHNDYVCPICDSCNCTAGAKVAYTIGRTSSYELAIKEPGGTNKLGKRLSENPPYEGGWVWRTWSEADYFRVNLMSMETPEWKPEDFSVYELELPSGWDIDVCSDLINQSGAHHLINDAKIICAVNGEL
jgi:hypothetical protein